MNEVTRRALQSAGIPSILEPTGLDRGDGKRPDGMTIFPYAHGKSLLWDATCVNTYAETNIALAATSSGAAAGEAEAKKRRKYAGLRQGFQFEPVAFETAGACGPTTRAFIKELGARLAASSGDRREAAWLWQRFAIAVIRGNAVSVLSTTTPKSGPTSQQQQQPLSERQQREQLQQMQQISKAAPPRQQQQPLQQILQRPGTYQEAEDNSSPESLPKTMQGKQDSENSDSDLHILDLETSTDRDQPMPPRSKDPLLEFRKMYLQMCSEIRSSEVLDDRNPMSDPDLAYYLAGKRPDKSELSDEQLRGRELRGQTNHSSTDKSRDRSPRHHDWHERRLRRRAACAEPREDPISHAEDGEERLAAGGSSPRAGFDSQEAAAGQPREHDGELNPPAGRRTLERATPPLERSHLSDRGRSRRSEHGQSRQDPRSADLDHLFYPRDGLSHEWQSSQGAHNPAGPASSPRGRGAHSALPDHAHSPSDV